MARGAHFGRDTAVAARGDGRYHAVLSAEWGAPLRPQGGIVTAVAVRAMAAELAAPEQRLRSVTTVFAAQVRPGAVDIEVRASVAAARCRSSPRRC